MENQQTIAIKKLPPTRDIMNNAWKFYTLNFKKMWVLFLLGGLGDIFSRFTYSNNSSGAATPFDNISLPILASVIITFVAIGLILFISKIALLKGISDVHKGQFIGVKDALKKGSKLFWPFVLLNIILTSVLFGSFILFIVPCIVLSGYLVFSQIQILDNDKRHFNALLASWALVKGYWWAVLGRIMLTSLILGLSFGLGVMIVMAFGFLAVFLTFKISSVLAISIAVILGILVFAVVVLFLQPFVVIILFELYISLKNVQSIQAPVVSPALELNRKRKILVSMVIGVVALIPLVYFGNKLIAETIKLQSSIPVSTGEYHSSVGSFSVDFLGQPTVSVEDKESVNGPYKIHYFKNKVNQNLFFFAVYADMQTDINDKTLTDQILTSAMDNASDASVSKVVSSRISTYMGYPSIDFLMYEKSHNVYVKSRTVINEQGLYGLVTSYSGDKNKEKYAAAADVFLNSLRLDSQVTNQPATSSLPVSGLLQKIPYVSGIGSNQFQINLPINWSYKKSQKYSNDVINKITSFAPESGKSTITVSEINTAKLRGTVSSSTDDMIADELASQGVSSMKDKFTELGLEGFQVSNLKKQAFGSDTAYVYRGSAASEPTVYGLYDFELITIFNKKHGYQILTIWPESEYGWYAKPLLQSLATFRIN